MRQLSKLILASVTTVGLLLAGLCQVRAGAVEFSDPAVRAQLIQINGAVGALFRCEVDLGYDKIPNSIDELAAARLDKIFTASDDPRVHRLRAFTMQVLSRARTTGEWLQTKVEDEKVVFADPVVVNDTKTCDTVLSYIQAMMQPGMLLDASVDNQEAGTPEPPVVH